VEASTDTEDENPGSVEDAKAVLQSLLAERRFCVADLRNELIDLGYSLQLTADALHSLPVRVGERWKRVKVGGRVASSGCERALWGIA